MSDAERVYNTQSGHAANLRFLKKILRLPGHKPHTPRRNCASQRFISNPPSVPSFNGEQTAIYNFILVCLSPRMKPTLLKYIDVGVRLKLHQIGQETKASLLLGSPWRQPARFGLSFPALTTGGIDDERGCVVFFQTGAQFISTPLTPLQRGECDR